MLETINGEDMGIPSSVAVRNITALDGGKYLVTGNQGDGSGFGNADHWACRIDLNGNIDWSEVYGDAWNNQGQAGIGLSDGSLLMAGAISAFGGNGGSVNVASIMRTDSIGNLIWNFIYPSSNSFTRLAISQSLVETPDGGAITAGYTNGFGLGSEEMALMRLDETGQVLWSNAYGTNQNERAIDVIALKGQHISGDRLHRKLSNIARHYSTPHRRQWKHSS